MKRISSFILFFLISVIAFGLNPKKNYEIKPDQFGMEYEVQKISTEDGLQLHAWYFAPSDPKSIKCMIISHDGKGNMEDMIELAGNFLSLGYHVITYDYRGYGKSDDFEISDRFYIYAQFAKDVEAAIEHVRKKINGIRQIDLYGEQIGAGLSIAVGAGQHTHVRNIIVDSPYYSMENIREKYMQEKGENMLVPVGFDKNTFEPAHAMNMQNAGRKRFMFIAGKDDKIYTKGVVKDLEKMTDKGYIYLVKNATAETTFTSDRQAYFRELKKFLNQ